MNWLIDHVLAYLVAVWFWCEGRKARFRRCSMENMSPCLIATIIFGALIGVVLFLVWKYRP